MDVFYGRSGELWRGDCVSVMSWLRDFGYQANCVVTSPPYFGLRDYGVEGQIGLEQTPDEYVAKLVGVFRAVREVLADDGTLWLNLGDSYNNFRVSTNGQSVHSGKLKGKFDGRRPVDRNLKEKDLIGIPWRVAFALQSDGWYLRQDIIWHKPNPMPESVRDRCTKAHEYVFLLSKGPKYFYDAEAVKEKAAESTVVRLSQNIDAQEGSSRVPGKTNGNMKAVGSDMRNRRSVWTVSTKPFKGAHFATFPPDLIEPCILAGCPVGGTVLDPFMGAGTTALVSEKLGRRWVGAEINPDYCGIAMNRLK